MITRIAHAIAFAVALLFFQVSGVHAAVEVQQSLFSKVESSPNTKKLETQAEPSFNREVREAVKEQRELLQKQFDNHFVTFDKTIDRVLWGLGILFLVAIGLVTFFLGSSKSEIKTTVKEIYERESAAQIEKYAEQIRRDMESIHAEVDGLTAYRNQNIKWVFARSAWQAQGGQEENPKQILAATITQILGSMGLENVQLAMPENYAELNLGNADLVILSYDPNDGGIELLRVLIEKMKAFSPPVFLIIDTYNPDGEHFRLSAQEMAVLRGFHWYVPVNFPSQLVAQVNLLIRRNRSSFTERA